MPVFSIILPVYNAGKCIKQCLDSILSQTFNDWDCYICNDCSNDNTRAICEEYAMRDRRFVIINSKHPKYAKDGSPHPIGKDMSGISKMLNIGIAVSESEYILRMDADDVMLPRRLEITYNWMKGHPDCDIAGFPLIYKGKTYNLSNMLPGGKCGFSSLAQNIRPYHPTVCMRRETVMQKTQFLYQQPYDGCEDGFLWFHALMWGCDIRLADTEPVLKYNGGNSSEYATGLYARCCCAYAHAINKETNKIQPGYLEHYKEGREMSIVIGFRNEGAELEKTIMSFLLSDDDINIVLVDDASDDGYEYKRVADTFGCLYIRNEKPLGCAPARSIGVSHINTPYFILTDAHMRVNTRQQKFTTRFVRALKEDDSRIVQCNTIVMRSNSAEDMHFRSYTNEDCAATPEGAACAGAVYNHAREGRDWASEWCYKYIDGKEKSYPANLRAGSLVECVSLMGAVYAMSKKWWGKIGGLDGLVGWGHDEPLLSIKTYLMGGRVMIFPKYGIGHLYRKTPIYGNSPASSANLNLLFIQYIMSHAERGGETDEMLFEVYKKRMLGDMAPDKQKKLLNDFAANKPEYDKIKSYIWDNATRKISDIRALEKRLS